MKETLKSMKTTLISQTQPQIANLHCADYEELGAAIDMIKDLEEALYYCTIIEAMEGKDKESDQPIERNNTYYYTEKYMPMRDEMGYRDMDRPYGRMYYPGGNNSGSSNSSSNGSNNSSTMNYREYPMMDGMRDSREGRSPMSRKYYMESKSTHQDKAKQLKDLENYMQELTTDITEMIDGASPEEKQVLQKKLALLSTKIEQMK